jgi:hypothetical protein
MTRAILLGESTERGLPGARRECIRLDWGHATKMAPAPKISLVSKTQPNKGANKGEETESIPSREMRPLLCRQPHSYFQNGFFNPAGLSALSSFASAPESSEIFSSVKRDEGACNSSGQ